MGRGFAGSIQKNGCSFCLEMNPSTDIGVADVNGRPKASFFPEAIHRIVFYHEGGKCCEMRDAARRLALPPLPREGRSLPRQY